MVWRSLFRCFWHSFCCCTRTFLHIISIRGSICFFFIIYTILFFFCFFFFAYFIIFMFIFIITRLYWDGLFTKKEFVPSLSCVSGMIIVSVLDVRWFIEVKISTSVSPISSDSLFWWLLLFCVKVIRLLELSWFALGNRSSNQKYLTCQAKRCLGIKLDIFYAA